MSSNLEIRVKVSNTNPVVNARVGLALSKDGTALIYVSGYTNSAGELAYLLQSANNGVYAATISTVYKVSYVWDKNKSVISTSYALSR